MPSVTVMVVNSRGVPPAALTPELDRLGLADQRDVAGRGLVPAGGDADERLVDLVGAEAHGVVVGAVRRPLGALRDVPAGQLRLVEQAGADVVGHGIAIPSLVHCRGNSRIVVAAAACLAVSRARAGVKGPSVFVLARLQGAATVPPPALGLGAGGARQGRKHVSWETLQIVIVRRARRHRLLRHDQGE